jgi:hypothetical protein
VASSGNASTMAKTTRTRVHVRFVIVLLTGVWSIRQALFAFCVGRVGVDGGADDERGNEDVAETTEACGTGTLPL